MNYFPLRLADGTFFFAGMFLASACLLAFLWTKSRPVRLLLRIIIFACMLFVILSSTPISIWLYIFWSFLVLLSLALNHIKLTHTKITKVKFGSTLVTVILSFLLLGFELPHYFTPTISLKKNTRIYVIGDSLSAGLDEREKNWPMFLAEKTHLDIVNLAQPGANTQTAQKQMNKIPASGATVIVEIGGNDLLGKTDSSTFRTQLEVLLKFLRTQNHQIIMFELPLPPFKNAFGAAQRDLAKKYDVTLIPKRVLTNIFIMKNGTLDGIHLSQIGHQTLAASFRNLLVW